MRTSTIWTILVAGAGLVGCADSGDSTEPTPTTPIREQLLTRPTFTVDPEGFRAPLYVYAAQNGDPRYHNGYIDLKATDAAIPVTVDADGNLKIEEARFHLGPVSLELLGQPDTTLANAELRLYQPVTAPTQWSEDGQYGYVDALHVTFALEGQPQVASRPLPVLEGILLSTDLSLFVAPVDETGSAAWLWINGRGTAKVLWGDTLISAVFEPHVDAYNNIIQ